MDYSTVKVQLVIAICEVKSVIHLLEIRVRTTVFYRLL